MVGQGAAVVEGSSVVPCRLESGFGLPRTSSHPALPRGARSKADMHHLARLLDSSVDGHVPQRGRTVG
jgi:hypothetical protein